jgi:preprotein translocase subunit SecG
MSLLIGIFTAVLVFVSIILVFLVLMQKAKSDAGVAAMGGGGMESAFGAEAGNVLSGATIKAAIAFFVLSFGLYLAHIYQSKHQAVVDNKLPVVTAPALPAVEPAAQPVTPPPSEPAKQ